VDLPFRVAAEFGDDRPQGEETLIDVRALLQPLPLGLGLADALRAGQVNEGLRMSQFAKR
jgi:hypothetical protein